MKRMYRLSYIDKNKKIIPIDLTGCENYINGDIQFIDSVTMKFSNEKELIDEIRIKNGNLEVVISLVDNSSNNNL